MKRLRLSGVIRIGEITRNDWPESENFGMMCCAHGKKSLKNKIDYERYGLSKTDVRRN